MGGMTDVPPEQQPPPAPTGARSEETRPTQPVPAQDQAAHDQTPTATRFRDRLWGLRAVIAVALAAVVLGGLGGAALASIGDHQDERRSGPGRGQFGRGPGGPPGQMRHFQQRRGHGFGQGQGRGQQGFVPPGQQQPAPSTAPSNPPSPSPTT